MEEENCLSNTLNIVTNLSQNIEHFLEVHQENADTLKKATKNLYDFTYKQLPVNDGLSELVTENFDNEQIWQELELYNTGVIGELVKDLSHLLAGKEKISFKTTATSDKEVKEDGGSEGKKEDYVEEERDEEEEVESDEELKKIKSRLKVFEKLTSKKTIASDLDSDSDGDPSDLAKEFHEGNVGPHGEEDQEEDVEEEEKKEMRKTVQKPKEKNSKKTPHSTIVDDKFFKLSEMDTFLKQQDSLEVQKSKEHSESEDEEEKFDMFQDIGSDQEENVDKLKFKDFFRGPEEELPSKRVRFSDDVYDEDSTSYSADEHSGLMNMKKSKLFESDDDDDDDDDSESHEVSNITKVENSANEKSTFELRQERLQQKISQLEKASISDKSWQLTGEVSASARPENSLLEEHVQFDNTLKTAPEVTEETTKTLEDLIIQRIKDKAWDDVERKEKTADIAFEYKKATVLDQEKSKFSLGEIYEKEYQKQQEQEENKNELSKDQNDVEHEEIKNMMNSLFLKLDALSNFHFTPKILVPDVKIVSNLPSITMEEVAPVAVSENQLAAPRELLDPLRKSLKSQSERSVSERNKERKLKKKLKKIKWQEKEKQQRLREMLDPDSVKTSKKKALRKLEKQGSRKVTVIKTNLKKGKVSSSDFFNKLQNEVSQEITKKKKLKNMQNGDNRSSVQLKL